MKTPFPATATARRLSACPDAHVLQDDQKRTTIVGRVQNQHEIWVGSGRGSQKWTKGAGLQTRQVPVVCLRRRPPPFCRTAAREASFDDESKWLRRSPTMSSTQVRAPLFKPPCTSLHRVFRGAHVRALGASSLRAPLRQDPPTCRFAHGPFGRKT